ncbi:atlastin-1-like [Oscarella lobularis]|uniref:atlastin-1-like n=1 Tax=Oscarella lobularis TaxID=121494 RepID=UPI0033140906
MTGVEDVAHEKPTTDEKAVQVVVAKDDHTFELDVEALESILLRDDVKDKTVAVVSVAGAFRKGKSFLLNFFLRYLSEGCPDSIEEWIGRDEEPLEGFHWRGGSNRDTTGILMWNRPFIVKHPISNEEVAVLLMDTQGAFDTTSTVKDCATIFALSTMISSIQVYNISSMIREDDLQHLQLFTEYGRLALKDSLSKPFQRLAFLVRDWSYAYERPYGYKGGEEYLESLLKVSSSQHEQLKMVREHIRECFEHVDCFLLPHPGLTVAENPEFTGKLSEIDDKFKEQLGKFTPSILAPRHLILKSVNGSKLNGRGLIGCFQSYVKIFQRDELPEPKSVLEATAEANNLAAQAAALDFYNKEMEKVCGGDKPFISPTELEGHHSRNLEGALQQFNGTRKMGGPSFSHSYLEQLEKQIEEAYQSFVKQNNGKNIFNAFRSPAVLIVLVVVAWLIRYPFSFFGPQILYNLFSWALVISMIALVIWTFARMTGRMRGAASVIDWTADLIWDQLFAEIYAKSATGIAKTVIKTKIQ